MTLINKELNVSVLGLGDAGVYFETRDYPLENRYSRRVQFTDQESLISGSLGSVILDKSRLDYLKTWFHAARGREKTWLLRVPGYSRLMATGEDAGSGQLLRGALVSIGGAATQYQIMRLSEGVGGSVQKPIRFPIVDTVRVYQNGIELANGFVVDELGVIQFSIAVTGILTVSCTYLTPVRFDTDTLNTVYVRDDRYVGLSGVIPEAFPYSHSMSPCNTWYQVDSLPFIEVLPPF